MPCYRLLLMSLAVAACAEGRPKATTPDATTPTGWRLELERTIDPAEGSPGELGILDAVAIDDDGYVYASQRTPERILLFGPNGAYLRTIGRQGEGPGDVRLGYFATFGDTVAIQQTSNSRLSLFRRSGEYLASARTGCCYAVPQLARDSVGRYWAAGSMLVDGFPGWVRLDATLKRLDVIGMVRDRTLQWPPKSWTVPITINGRNGAANIQVPLLPRVLQVPTRAGVIAWGRTDRPTLLLSRDGRDTVRQIALPLTPLPMSDGQRDSVVHAAVTRANSSGRFVADWSKVAVATELPADWPLWHFLASDQQGRIWVGAPDGRGPLGRVLVYSPDGELLGEPTGANPRLFDGYFGKDRVVVPDEDAEGRPIIRVYRIITQ